MQNDIRSNINIFGASLIALVLGYQKKKKKKKGTLLFKNKKNKKKKKNFMS